MLKLLGQKKDVRCVAYAPDGRVVSGGSDKTLRIWNPINGECTASIKTGNIIYAVAASPDGLRIAYAGRAVPRAVSNFVQVCDFAGKAASSQEIQTYGRFWRRDPVTGILGNEQQPVARTIWSLSFSADGNYLAAAVRQPGGGNIPDGGGGFYWHTGTAEPHTLPGENIYAVAFSPAGHGIAVTRKSFVRFLAQPSDKEGMSYSISASWSPAVAFVPGKELAAIASNSFIEFVNPLRQEKPSRVKTGIRTISSLVSSPDGKTLLAGGRPGTVEVYDTQTRGKRAVYDFGLGGIHSVAYSPDGLTFAVAGEEGLIVCDASD